MDGEKFMEASDDVASLIAQDEKSRAVGESLIKLYAYFYLTHTACTNNDVQGLTWKMFKASQLEILPKKLGHFSMQVYTILFIKIFHKP